MSEHERRVSSSEQSATDHQDDEPLIDGEQAGVSSKFKRVWHGFLGNLGIKRGRQSAENDREHSNNNAEGVIEEDVETGRLGSPAQSLTEENRETRVSEAGPSNLGHRHHSDSLDSPGRGSPRSPRSSSDSETGILNSLWRLGGAAIPQPQRNSSVNATCLICLENLTPEEFASGEAIILDCECRGDVAMRHRSCVEKWTHVKGNRTCDICKTLIKNLPDPPPRAPETHTPNGTQIFDDGEMLRTNAQMIVEQTPTGTDVVFDCIRVTWIAMIVSILFFGMDIADALWTGAIVGMGYTIFVRAMYQYQLRMFLREQQRERENEAPAVEGQPPHVTVI